MGNHPGDVQNQYFLISFQRRSAILHTVENPHNLHTDYTQNGCMRNYTHLVLRGYAHTQLVLKEYAHNCENGCISEASHQISDYLIGMSETVVVLLKYLSISPLKRVWCVCVCVFS